MTATTWPVKSGQVLEIVVDQATADLLNEVHRVDPGMHGVEFSVQTQAVCAMRHGLVAQIKRAEEIKPAEVVAK